MRVLFRTGGRIWRFANCVAPCSPSLSLKGDDIRCWSAQNPDQIPHVRNTSLVIEALNAGDLEAALALYERYATFVPEPGKPVSGHKAIREALRGFLAIKPRLTVEVPQVQTRPTLWLRIAAMTVAIT